MRIIRVPEANEIETAQDLMMFLRQVRIAQNRIAWESANVGLVVRAMLRKVDKIEGKNRRGKIARACLELSIASLAASGFASLGAVRLRNEYPELFGQRRKATRRGTGQSWHRGVA